MTAHFLTDATDVTDATDATDVTDATDATQTRFLHFYWKKIEKYVNGQLWL